MTNPELHPEPTGRHVSIGDTRLYIAERGQGYPLMILHGGPGLDHHMFGDYLDPLADSYRLIFVDQRSQGLSDKTSVETWTLQQMAADVTLLAEALGLERYAVLGHSYGAFVALQNAVDFPGRASQTIVSGGLPSARFLAAVDQHLAAFEPESLRAQVTSSWEREKEVQTEEEVADLMRDQMPFHFADPLDPRLADYAARTAGMIGSPEVLRHFATLDYGGIEVEDRLGQVTQPVLVLAGRYERTCIVEGAEAMATSLPNAKLVIFKHSAHMTFVEENERYLATIRDFLQPDARV